MITSAPVEQVVPEHPEDNLESFGALVDRHQSMVFSMAYSFLRNRASAEELAQDVFLELHRNLGRLESPDHIVHWLRRVTAHRAIDRQRSFRFWAPLAALLPEPAVQASSEADPWLTETLAQLIAALPPKQKMVVILRFQEDLDVAEIARTLDIPERKVRSHLQWSLALLREKLARRGVERSI